MKNAGLLNAPLNALIAELGHTDTLVIADAGLPIPLHVPRIDLAITPGFPDFRGVLDAVLAELCIEGATLAEEITTHNAALEKQIHHRLNQLMPAAIAPAYLSHEHFKARLQKVRGVVRTGECTPYANILLHCGVPF
ncbi:D-ribose pyranase [Kushneria phosphatilytica]|uniref:D-ribose pyranase n=1 Tax=Kushneria phosphatilytica TaxID=657387 RepID=A0A1S1NT52_9GAMM|nr:D-ribose pyranase [Kushneria phosphatilytica]OHV08765.1 D-ribose pyranase [Kushneria phosphatilytica]QEL12484.1 D-ribose pyranase [Kushneria phosphatilytica]